MNSNGHDRLAQSLRTTSDRVEVLVDHVSEMSTSIAMLRKDMSRVLTIVRGTDEAGGLVVRLSRVEDQVVTVERHYARMAEQVRRDDMARQRGLWAVIAATVGAIIAGAVTIFGGHR